jgi:hypothetical protein
MQDHSKNNSPQPQEEQRSQTPHIEVDGWNLSCTRFCLMTQHIKSIVEKENGRRVHKIVVFYYLQESIHFELWGWISNHEDHESTRYTICDKYVAYRNSKATC